MLVASGVHHLAVGGRRDPLGKGRKQKYWGRYPSPPEVLKGNPLACLIPFCTGSQNHAPIEQSAADSLFCCVGDPVSLVACDKSFSFQVLVEEVHSPDSSGSLQQERGVVDFVVLELP